MPDRAPAFHAGTRNGYKPRGGIFQMQHIPREIGFVGRLIDDIFRQDLQREKEFETSRSEAGRVGYPLFSLVGQKLRQRWPCEAFQHWGVSFRSEIEFPRSLVGANQDIDVFR